MTNPPKISNYMTHYLLLNGFKLDQKGSFKSLMFENYNKKLKLLL